MLRIQGQLSNNIGACVCLCVVDATSNSLEEVFCLSLRTKKKEIEKKDEGEREEREKENIFATACLLAFDSRRGLVKKREEEEKKKTAEQKRALAPRPIGHRSTDQH